MYILARSVLPRTQRLALPGSKAKACLARKGLPCAKACSAAGVMGKRARADMPEDAALALALPEDPASGSGVQRDAAAAEDPAPAEDPWLVDDPAPAPDVRGARAVQAALEVMHMAPRARNMAHGAFEVRVPREPAGPPDMRLAGPAQGAAAAAVAVGDYEHPPITLDRLVIEAVCRKSC